MSGEFVDLPPGPDTHFQLCTYAAVSHLLLSLAHSFGSLDGVLREFPFLEGYRAELETRRLIWSNAAQADEWWSTALRRWETNTEAHLPLRALRAVGALEPAGAHAMLTLFVTAGLIEEDSRFGVLFESLQGTGRARPTAGLLIAWWPAQARSYLKKLQQLGLVEILNPEAPRSEQMLYVPAPIWDAARGDTNPQPAAWARYYDSQELHDIGDLILPSKLERQLGGLPALLQKNGVQTVVLRGPEHNGRHTILGALARRLGRGVIDIPRARQLDAGQARLVGPLATLLHTMPVLAYELAPGESLEIPELAGSDAPLGIVLSTWGGLTGRAMEHAITLPVEMPGPAARKQHWQRAAGSSHPVEDLDFLSEHCRLASGNLWRVAPLAYAQAQLDGRQTITAKDVQQAARALHRQALETLATRLDTFGDWSHLAVGEDTRRDLLELEARCRQRERLAASVGAAFGSTVNPGVRALFTGPSGTGKTLAARVLAAQLQMDVYRLDLSGVVNKYIGETEKNLNLVFARAEELDVILLIDEGDALLGQRTSVSNANDRYANLETNFLLQRLESFGGIVLITTNSSERIDRAFQRRMDVVIDFRPPDAGERWLIWQLHLPQRHLIEPEFLDEIVMRCTLTGGQIRNAALHATLLAINNGGLVTSEYLDEAVQREFRQSGAVCPLLPFEKNGS